MKYGLIGEHLSHSFSKRIHEEVGKYPYDLIELTKDQLDTFFMEKDFSAINVTIPYKESVIKYLDELDGNAKSVGAVNCITNINGYLKGYNTDVAGFIYLLESKNISVNSEVVLILGSGGASKAVKAACQKLGAKEILIASRSSSNEFISYEDIYDRKDIGIIVNTTPVGMYPHNEDDLLVDLDKLPNLKGVVDVIYNPIRTRLVIEAEKRKIPAIGGLYMLIGQAYEAMKIFIGLDFSKKDIDATYSKIKSEKSNIVLIGMPSSGKTTISKKLGKLLNMTVIDTDEEIVKFEGRSIKEIFEKDGEEYFREIENQIIKSIYLKENVIISTGGGIIKNRKNIDLLKENGSIYFINRDINKLIVTDDRPLSNEINKIKKLYSERLPIYKECMDTEIENNKDIDSVIKQIIKKENR